MRWHNLSERSYIKAFNFDLDIHKLEEYYPKDNYRKAYYDLSVFMKCHDFLHRQGSGYISKQKMASKDIYTLIEELSQQFSWMEHCVRKFDVTNVGRQHDLTDLFKANQDIVLEEEELLVYNEHSFTEKDDISRQKKRLQDVKHYI